MNGYLTPLSAGIHPNYYSNNPRKQGWKSSLDWSPRHLENVAMHHVPNAPKHEISSKKSKLLQQSPKYLPSGKWKCAKPLWSPHPMMPCQCLNSAAKFSATTIFGFYTHKTVTESMIYRTFHSPGVHHHVETCQCGLKHGKRWKPLKHWTNDVSVNVDVTPSC